MAAAVRDASASVTPTRNLNSMKTKAETSSTSAQKTISVSGERRDEVAASLLSRLNNNNSSNEEKTKIFPKMKDKPSKEVGTKHFVY